MERSLRAILIEVDQSIIDTIHYANDVINYVLRWCYDNKETNYYRAHDALYKELRKQFLNLQSSLIQSCIEVATQIHKKEPDKLHIKKRHSSIRLNARCFTPWMDTKTVSLVTIQKRKKYKFKCRDNPPWYKPDIKSKSIRLRIKGRRVEVDFCYTLPTPDITVASTSKVVGVDLGIRAIAVTNDNRFLNKDTKKHQRRYAYNRQVLQHKGTRSAHRRLKTMSGRERRFVRDRNHCIAKEIVDNSDVVVVEDLSQIRKRVGNKGRKFNRRFYKWSFAELSSLIEEKCEASGKLFLKIDPKNTSKQCSRCETLNEVKKKREYECDSCGLHLNRDLNAARNISQRGNALLGRLLVNQPYGWAKPASKPPNLFGGN